MREEQQVEELEDGSSSNTVQLLIFGGVLLVVGIMFFGIVAVVLILKSGNDDKKDPYSSYGASKPAVYYPSLAVEKKVAYDDDLTIRERDLTTEDRTQFRDLDLSRPVEDLNVVYDGPVVTSKPPLAVAGTQFQYQITTQSKVGISEYIVLSGTKGMTVSNTGIVNWQVEKDYKGTESGSVSVVDKNGRFYYHTFPIAIR